MTRVLDVNGLTGSYGAVQILYGIDLHIDEGEFVTIIGPNGCGKSTFIKALFGYRLLCQPGQLQGQECVRDADRPTCEYGDRICSSGKQRIPLPFCRGKPQMGGNSLSANILSQRINRALDMFPDLRSREHDLAASLSGGERQMLAISRALISDPNFLLLDEPTAALSPLYQQQIIERIDALREQGITVLIVEQNARLSLSRSDRGYIMSNGKIVHSGGADHILTDLKSVSIS